MEDNTSSVQANGCLGKQTFCYHCNLSLSVPRIERMKSTCFFPFQKLKITTFHLSRYNTIKPKTTQPELDTPAANIDISEHPK